MLRRVNCVPGPYTGSHKLDEHVPARRKKPVENLGSEQWARGLSGDTDRPLLSRRSLQDTPHPDATPSQKYSLKGGNTPAGLQNDGLAETPCTASGQQHRTLR
jgi:hypothetical protein